MGRLGERVRRFLLGTKQGQSIVAAAPQVPVGEVFRRFWPYARPYRRWLLVTLVFIVIVAAVDTALVWMFKLVVDEVLVPGDFGPLVWIALAYLGLTLLDGIVSFYDEYLSTWVGERFLLSLRTSFFRHLQGLSLDFFERRKLGDVISRLTGDIGAIESFVLSGIADALSYAFRIVFFVGALFYLQWDLALAALVVIPLFWAVARSFSRMIKQASREKRRRSGSISAAAEESFSNIALVQSYNRQEAEVGRFHRENLGSFEATMAATRLKAAFTPLINLIELAGVLVVVVMGTWELTQGRLSLGGLLAFLAYLGQLYSPIRGLSRLTNTIYAASAAAERIIEFLDQRPSVVEKPGAVSLPRARGVVEFEDVSFRYPETARDALDSVSFRVEPGETLALVGASGAGKSTVAKLLLRFYDPTAGRVALDGRNLRDLSLHSLREDVAVLLQETLVFDGTIRENIAYGKPGATGEEIARAAAAADAHEFIMRLPEGYDTVMGQKGRRLSGGQRQRIAIARAMIRDAPVVILDEPTTGLDAESGERILEPMRRLMAGRTTIIISHNLTTVREASRILVLEDGRVAESGTHPELIARGAGYARLYNLHHVEAETPRAMKGTEPRAERSEQQPVAPPLSAGELLAPDYEVVEHLSRGRVLDVYDVWSEERACRCIAKVLRPDRLEDRKWKNRLLREGRILKRLTHLHLVRAYEVLREPRPIVILETLTGDTLEYLISTQGVRRMPVGDIVYLGLHLCSAMHYLHRQGILHLDLKPSNVISNLGVAKVLDLSIARPPGRVRGGAGTRQYMAPEQAYGGPVDEKADVWGIGAVLFEAATGRRPFEAEEGERYQQLERRADFVRANRRAPAALATAIDRCLDPEPGKRPTVDELADALDALALEP